jgi:hypothetical protein
VRGAGSHPSGGAAWMRQRSDGAVVLRGGGGASARNGGVDRILQHQGREAEVS